MSLLQLTQKEGIGPKTVRKLHDTMHINNMKELRDQIAKGKLNRVKGFGKGKITLLNNALNSILGEQKRWPIQQAIVMGNKMIEELKKIAEVNEVVLAGSIRRKKETIIVELTEEEESIIFNFKDSSNTIEEELIQAEKSEKLSNLLNKLNEKEKEIINLRFYENKSYKEISKELNITLDLVRIRLYRTIRELRKINCLKNNFKL